MELLLLTNMLCIFCGAFAADNYRNVITGHGTLGRFYSALATNDKVWLYASTVQYGDQECVYFKMKSRYQEMEYEFDRGTRAKLRENITHWYGRLSMVSIGDQGPSITFRKKEGGAPGTEYIVLHWDLTNNCGVLLVRKNAKQPNIQEKCEMYILDKNVNRDASVEACKGYYKFYCPQNAPEHIIYNDKCQLPPGC